MPYAPRASTLVSTRRIGAGDWHSAVVFEWYPWVVAEYTEIAPTVAFREAAFIAAAAAAAKIGGRGRGYLAMDVRRPKFFGARAAFIGSDKIYARIEDQGGLIQAHVPGHPMLIHSGVRDAGGRFQQQAVVGSAYQVYHRGKHYLAAAAGVFEAAYMAALKREMPG